MTKYFFKAMVIMAIMGVLNTGANAQQDKNKGKLSDNDEIIIMKKGDKDTKLTVEIKDGEVSINGKPLSEYNEGNVIIRKRNEGPGVMGFGGARSPFRRDSMFFKDSELFRNNLALTNKAALGVVMEKGENGAKITKVIAGSGAEKAGLKEDDIITKVDETIITGPEELTKAIGKFKEEDKTVVTYKREGKEQKATVVLGKREGANSIYRNNFELNRNFNFDMNPRLDMLMRPGSPRLGIKAQDTEDGKGVKVLDVDDESNAQKAGVKEGDIITQFDGKNVNSAPELADAAREARDKSPIKVKINRNGKSQEIEIKIPRKLKTANL